MLFLRCGDQVPTWQQKLEIYCDESKQAVDPSLIRTCFPDRKSCLKYCRETYIAIAQHDLVLGKSCNDRLFSLVCRDCRVVVVEAKLSSKEDFFVIEDFGIKSGHKFPGNSDSWCEPNNRRRASIICPVTLCYTHILRSGSCKTLLFDMI